VFIDKQTNTRTVTGDYMAFLAEVIIIIVMKSNTDLYDTYNPNSHVDLMQT